MSSSPIPTPTHTAVRRNSAPSPAAAFQHIITLAKKTSPPSNSEKLKRTYKCSHCSTTFRRSEHCVRHERSHTMEKPYGCSICHCQFSRKDLVVRHERTVHSDRIPPASERPAKRQRKNSVASMPSPLPTVEEATHAIFALGGAMSPPPSRDSPEQQHSPLPTLIEKQMPPPPPAPLSPPESTGGSSVSPNLDQQQQLNINLDFTTEDLDEVLTFLPNIEGESSFSDLFSQGSPLDGLDLDLYPPPNENAVMAPEFCMPAELEQKPLQHHYDSPLSEITYIPEFSITREAIMADLETSGVPLELLSGFQIPSNQTLATYIESYFSTFHRHWPMLHKETFTSQPQKACLALAVCIIGAQYCLEKKRARYLYEWTKRILAVEEVRWRRSGIQERAWVNAARLLVGSYGLWSGESAIVQDAISEAGTLGSYFRCAQELVVETERLPNLSYSAWLENECLKRLCYGIFLHQSLISIYFNLPPSIPPSSIVLPLPCSSQVWDSPSPIMPATLPGFPFNSPITNPASSDFGLLLQSHAKLCTQWFQKLSAPCNYPHSPLTPPAFFSFSAPQTPYTPFPEHPYRYNPNPNPTTSPLHFTHAGLLRLHHLRDLIPSNTHVPSAVDPVTGVTPTYALTNYILHTTVERGTAATRAAETAVEVAECVIRAGVGTVKKTAALRWGFEHVIINWEAIVWLVRWVRALEGMHPAAWDDEERRVVGRLCALLADLEKGKERERGKEKKVAVELVRVWEMVLGDTWVWWVNPMLKEALAKVRVELEREGKQ
ncbi:hypothetical protein EX30DRAFT_373371 [Ascodesmis nigricans]|uniref:C2H2-type domain-containing protein n=1 Tax=Ascodesmis nigricans TaxID=341454 RepID=A0A4S2MPE9_9PEZI|nr:hypothetical protein EX30DRAFT_373371 [Ascodesmis nigricans]